MAERQSGDQEVLAEHGMEPRLFHGHPTRAFGCKRANRFVGSRECDAAVCFNDLVALGAVSGFASRGRAVGRDFQLVDFHDIEDAAQGFSPLTSVGCGIERFGQDMAATLMAWPSEGKMPVAEIRPPVLMIIRPSSSS